SDTFGSFFKKAAIVQISLSGTSILPKLGMPVMLMPFLITQNSSFGRRSLTTSLRSGGSGLSPSENFAHSTPGAPWQFQQPRVWNAFAPAWMLAGLSSGIGGASAALWLIEAVRT